MKKEFTFSYNHLDSIEDLNENQKKAIKAAEQACEKAYAPYSNFKVGAALLLNDNTLVLGSNQDKQGIKTLAIVGEGSLLKSTEFFTPCGGCRQAMAEYTEMQGSPFEIIMRNGDGSFLVFEGIHHILPFIFGSK